MVNVAIQSLSQVEKLYPNTSFNRRVCVLGIESTAHTFGVGVACTYPPFILSNVKSVYKPTKGGIHPREAASHHAHHAPETIIRALRDAGLSIAEINAIAIALGPGLGPCLRIGATIARCLASYYGKPLVPVNHALAHVEIGRLTTGFQDPLVVYVSGGHTSIIAYAKRRYRVFGETLDIALGNLLDTFAREVGIAPPYIIEGLHVVDYYAQRGTRIVNELPYVVKGQDVSYSGLLTAALRAYERGVKLEDICLTLREIAYGSVVEVAERGLVHTGKREVLVVGGVAASPILREKLRIMASYHDALVGAPPIELAGDNGAMIAWTGLLQYLHGIVIEVEDAIIKQRWRLDEVDVPWRS